ncbi:MAG: TlpA family protein disulfide reductase, partial [Gammaproteobacteria bacterium]
PGDDSWFIDHGRAGEEVKKARDSALPAASAPLNTAFNDARTKLLAGLRSFDPNATARLTQIGITVDGIIVRGAIETGGGGFHEGRKPAIVVIQQTEDGYSAFESWIPGGRITQYSWFLGVRRILAIGDTGLQVFITLSSEFLPLALLAEPHRFILPKQGSSVLGEYRVCLSIEGTQISPDGNLEGILGGSIKNCMPPVPEPITTLPPGWKTGTTRIEPPGPVEVPLDESIYAHIDAVSDTPPEIGFSTNHLVYFADGSADQPLAGLARALHHVSRRGYSLSVVVVLPVGSLHMSRREFNARLGLRDAPEMRDTREGPAPVPFEVTEDYEGGWTRLFNAREVPATFLINARGQYVWKQDGELDPGALGGALEEHALPAAAPQSRLPQLAVRPGDRVPDVYFEDDRGEFIALRRFRGQRILLNFWQSWSKPCLKELRRLQELQDQAGRDAPFIVALCGD